MPKAPKAPKALTIKKPKVSKLIKDLDSVLSIFIRQKYSDFHGYALCFTCNTRKPWQELQNGHYVSRSYKNIRFDETNTHPQCVACNIFKHGALDEYALALQRKYGEGILKELNEKKHISKKWTAHELIELIKHYRSAILK